jgi:hypothetical protein
MNDKIIYNDVDEYKTHSLQCVESNIGGKDEAAALIEQLFSAHQSFARV